MRELKLQSGLFPQRGVIHMHGHKISHIHPHTCAYIRHTQTKSNKEAYPLTPYPTSTYTNRGDRYVSQCAPSTVSILRIKKGSEQSSLQTKLQKICFISWHDCLLNITCDDRIPEVSVKKVFYHAWERRQVTKALCQQHFLFSQNMNPFLKNFRQACRGSKLTEIRDTRIQHRMSDYV